MLSSPYKRAIDTVRDFADHYGFQIETIEDFRERKIESNWIEDYTSFCKNQWEDFEYKLSDGESLGEVQKRNIAALKGVLKEYDGKSIVIGSHGTALSTIINYYDNTFGYQDFEKIRKLMPWIVKFTFEGEVCTEIQSNNLFESMPMEHNPYAAMSEEMLLEKLERSRVSASQGNYRSADAVVANMREKHGL